MCPICEHPLDDEGLCPICGEDFSEEELTDPSFYSQEDAEVLLTLRAFDY